jgi:hypothetical protein
MAFLDFLDDLEIKAQMVTWVFLGLRDSQDIIE